MYLKKLSNPSKKKDTKEGVIFIHTSGFSFDFPKTDTSLYFAATEDTTVHKCSVSYNEQYLDSYFGTNLLVFFKIGWFVGHQGPVYKVRCNPFTSDTFLTCSYDWTIRLWKVRENQPKITFNPPELNQQVNDIEWSVNTSTVFGSVAQDGRLEIWDIYQDALKPIITQSQV
jgi:dynein intermediate chain 4, axonemal